MLLFGTLPVYEASRTQSSLISNTSTLPKSNPVSALKWCRKPSLTAWFPGMLSSHTEFWRYWVQLFS